MKLVRLQNSWVVFTSLGFLVGLILIISLIQLRPQRGFVITSPPAAHSVDGVGGSARFWGPHGISIDAKGNIYIADTSDHIIRKLSSSGQVTTIAGSAGQHGWRDGPAPNARFQLPEAVAAGPDGALYIADSGNDCIRKITPQGETSVFAGISGKGGGTDGMPGTATIAHPESIVVAPSGAVFVTSPNGVRKILPTGEVTTLGGSRAESFRNGTEFDAPVGIAIDQVGNLIVSGSSTIRKITQGGIVTTLAGVPGHAGYSDGPAMSSQFHNPRGVAVDPDGNIYVADTFNFAIRKITPTGTVSTLAGDPKIHGHQDGQGMNAHFAAPWGLALDEKGSLYVTDADTVRKVDSSGLVSTVAGQ